MFISCTALWEVPDTLNVLVLGTPRERRTQELRTQKILVYVVTSVTKCRVLSHFQWSFLY